MRTWFLPHPLAGPAPYLLLAGLVLTGCSRQPLSPMTSAPAARAASATASGSSSASDDSRGASAAPAPAGDNLDPMLQIVLPRSSPLVSAVVPPTFSVRWEASDPDARSSRPLEYRYLLLDENSEFPMFTALVEPDSLRRRYGPRFEEWPRVPGGRPQVELSGLEPNARYLFVVVALDAAGGFNQVFTLGTNMLQFSVAYPGTFGPLIYVSGGITYRTAVGGLRDDPQVAPHFAISTDHALSLEWTAPAPFFDQSDGTRWALDPTKFDETSHGAGQEGGWSGWDPSSSIATVGPFAAAGEHRFYIEARTKFGLLTRLLLILDVAAPVEVARGRAE